MTCAVDTVIMGLFYLRKYDEEMFAHFLADKVLSKVLDLVQLKRGPEARVMWIEHFESTAAARQKTLSLAKKEPRDGGGQNWNCKGTCLVQQEYCNLFDFKRRWDYGDCSNGTFNCDFMEDYNDDNDSRKLPSKVRGNKYIPVTAAEMNNIQGFIDKYYHSQANIIILF